MKKIQVSIRLPLEDVTVESGHPLPERWNEMTFRDQEDFLIDLAVDELYRLGVRAAAKVVEVEDE